MSALKKYKKVTGVGLLGTLCLALFACDQGPTSGGGDRFEGTQFVSGDETTGRIVLEVEETELNLGRTTNFSVAVYDAKGRPVPNISVSCDSSLPGALAVVEPYTGADITNSRGVMSGVLQCSLPGSYQFGCRLPASANRRQFVGIKCVGEPVVVPTATPAA